MAGSRLPDGGGESHHFRGNRNPGPDRLPAPAAPHPSAVPSKAEKSSPANGNVDVEEWFVPGALGFPISH